MSSIQTLSGKRKAASSLSDWMDETDFVAVDTELEEDDSVEEAEDEEAVEEETWNTEAEEEEEAWEKPTRPARRRSAAPTKKRSASSRTGRRNSEPRAASGSRCRSAEEWDEFLISSRSGKSQRAAALAESDVFGLSAPNISASNVSASSESDPLSVASLAASPRTTESHTATSEFKPLPTSIKRKLKKRSFARFLVKTLFLGGVLAVGAWSVYGVSVEANLDFWRKTFNWEISSVADALFAQINLFVEAIG